MYRRLSRRATYLATANGSSAFVLASNPASCFYRDTHLTSCQHVVRLQHTPAPCTSGSTVGTAQRNSEWLLLDQSWRCVFCAPYENTAPSHRITRAIGPLARMEALHLVEFACTPGAILAKPLDFNVVKAEHYVDGNRRLLHVAEIDRLGGYHRMVAYGSRIHP